MTRVQTPRHGRWTREAWIAEAVALAAGLGIYPGQYAPTSGQYGAALCNAARSLWGSKSAADQAAGFVSNARGGAPAHLNRRGHDRAPEAPKPVLVRDPVVTAERRASERRQARTNWRDCTWRALGPRHMEIHQPSQELYLAHVIGPRVPGEARTERAA